VINRRWDGRGRGRRKRRLISSRSVSRVEVDLVRREMWDERWMGWDMAWAWAWAWEVAVDYPANDVVRMFFSVLGKPSLVTMPVQTDRGGDFSTMPDFALSVHYLFVIPCVSIRAHGFFFGCLLVMLEIRLYFPDST
jgi:hypothetical protein